MVKAAVTVGTVITTLLFVGCASQSGWVPTLDTYNDPNAARIELDLNECRQLADQATGDTGLETASGAAYGGFLGAATGAVIGAISGDPAAGAAIGGITGGASGAVRGGVGSNDTYKQAYSNCMRNRGHNVVN